MEDSIDNTNEIEPTPETPEPELEKSPEEPVALEGSGAEAELAESEDTEEPAEEEPVVHELTLSLDYLPVFYTGMESLVKATITCDQDCHNIEGNVIEGTLRVTNELTEEITSMQVAFSQEQQTVELAITAPEEPGKYTYQVAFQGPEEGLHTECAASFSVEVREHFIVLSVWGVPSPVDRGENFTIKVGARCPGNCSLVDTRIIISNADGEKVAEAVLGDNISPGTSGTYFTEVEMPAPEEDGVYTWHVSCESPELSYQHKAEELDFIFRTTAPAEFIATVTVFAAREKLPLELANVMFGYRRGYTDENGVAKIAVSGGTQMMRISKQDYRLFAEEMTIEGDEDFFVELVYDPTL